MNITIGQHTAEFVPWRPEEGQVFHSLYAFDSETTRIDEQQPWITPAYVLGAAFDGHRGYYIRREHVAQFFAIHVGVPIIMHNAPFDLAVVKTLAPGLDICAWVDRHEVWDTQLLHRLYVLGTEGHTATGKGQSTLETCADYYLGLSLPKAVVDSEGDDVRLSFGKWLNRSPQEIEPVYLDYLAKDPLVTFLIFQEQARLLGQLMETTNHNTWGYVSAQWLREQIDRWGWQTHHIQLKAAIVLRAITENGLCVDLDRRNEILAQLGEAIEERRQRLRRLGYMPGQKGSAKALQEILRQLERGHSELLFPKTKSNLYGTSEEALEDLASVEPFIRDLLDFRAMEKLRSTFLNKMGRQRLHPSFNVLVVTGRTSSFGEINAQNLPRDDRVRSCFVPSPGNIFIDADYSMLELATLAQSVVRQLQVPSEMANAINAGKDLHNIVAAAVVGKSESDVTDDERQKAKPINFGKPGAMGHDGLQRYAKASYGVELTDDEVKALSDAWFELFPEMHTFLDGGDFLGIATAQYFGLTPQSFFEHTGSRKFLDHPNNRGREEVPHAILGMMCLKVLRETQPQTTNGRDYPAGELDFFWAQVERRLDVLPGEFRQDIIARRPSGELRRAVMRLVDKAPCFTLTGRLRANASFPARHNTLFQGLAADGAKLGLWRLWRAGYHIGNFIHDEGLLEVPEDSDLKQHAEAIRRLMIEGMREVVPDVRIEVKYAASRQWHKKAKAIFDAAGRLIPWPEKSAVEGDGRP